MRRIISLTVLTIVLFAGSVAVAQNTVRPFDPHGKPPTKGYVEVEAYKWIRDNAPDAIASCDRTTDQFDDLVQTGVSKFKREAINCLASVGFFDNYPDVEPAVVEWQLVTGEEAYGAYVIYRLDAVASSAGASRAVPNLQLRCGIDNDYYHEVYVHTPWLLLNDPGSGTITTRWRFGDEGRIEVDDWGSNENAVDGSAVFAPTSFVEVLVGMDGEHLWMQFEDDFDVETVEFVLDGLDQVVADLECI